MTDTPALSVFTPLTRAAAPFVEEVWSSLLEQSDPSWEWIVILNDGGELPESIRSDERVRVFEHLPGSVGALKRRACELARAPLLVELDHDDLLSVDALERIRAAFEDPAVGFVFSDFAMFEDRSWAPRAFDRAFGWRSYPVEFRGHELTAMVAPDADWHTIRRVEWSPNHVRAWRASEYWRAGGHSADVVIGDDHELLVRCFLAGVKMLRVPACLYFQRMRADSFTVTRNAEIQARTQRTYLENIEALALRFARDNGLRAIDLCGGAEARAGFENWDRRCGIDLEEPWRCDANTVGVIRAVDALEHLRDPIRIMNAAYDALAPGGFLLIEVPSTDGRGAFQDPSHVSYWNSNSFWYYTDPEFQRWARASRARFQVLDLVDYYPSAFHEQHRIVYTRVHLCALKPGFHPMGRVLWPEFREEP